jgi:ATP/maltotriose-dependent transcriptional regulator MalT
MTDTLELGREAFERYAWEEAYTRLSALEAAASPAPEDLDLLATAAYLTGRETECEEIWARAHQEFVGRGEVERAARCVFWLAHSLVHRGERARAGGWMARARRLLDEAGSDCVEQGYLLLAEAYEGILEGDAPRAYAGFSQASEIGDRFGDPDLIALARHSRGRVLIKVGNIEEGVRLLDEAMAAVEAGAVSPMAAGDVYCSVIEGCLEIHDLRRAHEWTAALIRWCDAQPDLIPYSGQCQVYRAEVLQLHGAWPEAVDAAERACERFLHGSGQPAAGAAFYRQAELFRLRGDLAMAEESYRQASRWGRKPEPGLALLRLAQGRVDVAATGIRRALDLARERMTRSRLLPAYVEIMLAAGEVGAARSAAGELAELADTLEAQLPAAVAAHAEGAVLLAEGDAGSALGVLRRAWEAWQELDAPYEAARVRVLTGLAFRALGDEDSAAMELDAAGWAFQQLGAAPDAARVEALMGQAVSADPHGLTKRELEVLRLLAAGETNRSIAGALFISQRTVDRHVSNIFSKLSVSSRAAATAFAYKHQLV